MLKIFWTNLKCFFDHAVIFLGSMVHRFSAAHFHMQMLHELQFLKTFQEMLKTFVVQPANFAGA